MAKYRVVEEFNGISVRYYIEKRSLWIFWTKVTHWVRNNYYPIVFYSEKDATDWIKGKTLWDNPKRKILYKE